MDYTQLQITTMEIKKTNQELVGKPPVNQSTRHLLNSIQSNNQLEIASNLKNYQDAGMINFKNVLSIPLKDRIYGLVKQYGDKKIHGIITVMLTEFCNCFNVIRPMSAEQITQCAYDIIVSAEEDSLSIEDITIFFQGAKQGKYGKPVFDRLDQQIIFVMLEDYRDQRHREYLRLKEERESQFKKLGPKLRTKDDEQRLKDLFHDANVDYYKNLPHEEIKKPASKNKK